MKPYLACSKSDREGPSDGNRIVKNEVGIKEMSTSFLTIQPALSSAGQSAKLSRVLSKGMTWVHFLKNPSGYHVE